MIESKLVSELVIVRFTIESIGRRAAGLMPDKNMYMYFAGRTKDEVTNSLLTDKGFMFGGIALLNPITIDEKEIDELKIGPLDAAWYIVHMHDSSFFQLHPYYLTKMEKEPRRWLV